MKHTNGRITYWMLAVWNKKSKWRLLFAGVFGYSLFSTVVCFVITADVKKDITKNRQTKDSLHWSTYGDRNNFWKKEKMLMKKRRKAMNTRGPRTFAVCLTTAVRRKRKFCTDVTWYQVWDNCTELPQMTMKTTGSTLPYPIYIIKYPLRPKL